MITTLDNYFTTQTKERTEEEKINQKIIEKGYVDVETMSMSKKRCILAGYTELLPKEIAKLIRKDLKKAFGKTIKFSVKSSYNSISVTIKEISRMHIITREQYEEVPMVLEAKMYKETERYNSFINDYENDHITLYMIQDETYDKIKEIIDKYNYSNCDSYTDYYDYNFYDNLSTDYSIKVID